MKRRLRGILAATVAAGAAALGVGTANAEGYAGIAEEHGPAASLHHDESGCSTKFGKQGTDGKESDSPSSDSYEDESERTAQDARPSDGSPYYGHNATCATAPKQQKFDDDSYKTFNMHNGSFVSQPNRGYEPRRFEYDHYGPNRCQARSPDKNCEQDHSHFQKNRQRYGPNLDKVNGSNGYGG